MWHDDGVTTPGKARVPLWRRLMTIPALGSAQKHERRGNVETGLTESAKDKSDAAVPDNIGAKLAGGAGGQVDAIPEVRWVRATLFARFAMVRVHVPCPSLTIAII